jgi:hypothetical protein
VKLFFLAVALTVSSIIIAQEKSSGRAITVEEYNKAKTFSVNDLDKDSYIKFDNTYILDRYEARKPYFITGDDGLKKRIDLYKFLLKEGMQELGTMIFYTNEKGKLYKVCLPDFKADGKIWEQYFTDIHAIDKEEPNFVLKLSYVLSKEFGFQLYKAANAGKDLSKEAGTYGSDICFPGNMQVAMADGSTKMLSDIKAGDKVITVDAITKKAATTVVKTLAEHEAKNYALTQILLLSVNETTTATAITIQISSKELTVTPNHPILTIGGEKQAGQVKENDIILCKEQNGFCIEYKVFNVTEIKGALQKVYNMVAESGDTFMINDVMVKQKNSKQ